MNQHISHVVAKDMASYDLPLYRSWFPFLASGRIWLNHAAISPMSTRVRDALVHDIEERSTGAIDTFAGALPLFDRARRAAARLIGSSPDRIAFALNTSEGLNILAEGVDWKAGDRVLLNDAEFPANIMPFLNLKRHGVEIDFVKTRDGRVLPEDVAAALTPRTRIVSVSFVQFLSGHRTDLAAIGSLCRSRGIILSVDAIQGLGVVPLDAGSMNIDFLSCGGTKWLMGVMGIAIVYVSESLQDRLRQPYMGWTSNKNFFSDFFRYRIDLDDTARRYENGTLNVAGIGALEASMSTLLGVGIDAIAGHVAELTARLIAIADEAGFALFTPRDERERAGIVTFRANNADRLFAYLGERSVVVSLREGMIRVSPHFYNTIGEVETFGELLRSWSRHGRP